MKNLIFKASEVRQLGEVRESVNNYSCEGVSEGVTCQDMSVDFSLMPVEQDILLRGSIRGFFGLQCSRCLKSYKHPVEITLTQLYPPETGEINLEEEIRESLILNVPSKPLCGAGCRGLCPVCGGNLNDADCGCKTAETDPRWDGLKKFVK